MRTLTTCAVLLVAIEVLFAGGAYGRVERVTLPGHPIGFYADAPVEDAPLPVLSYRVGYRLAKHGLVGVPFILWPEAVEPLQDTAGWWHVISPPPESAGGAFEFRAGEASCRLLVAELSVPPAKADFGFYYERGRVPTEYRGADWEARHFADMAAHGHNTVTIYDYATYGEEFSWDDTDIDERIELAMKWGLVSKEHPVIVIEGSLPPHLAGELVKQVPSHWPEVLFYGPDEPSPANLAGIRQWANVWRGHGFRTTTALCGRAARNFSYAFDLWLVLRGDISRSLQALAAGNSNVILGTYDHQIRGTNYRLNRYYAGLYTWALYLRANYVWAYAHHPLQGILADGSYNLDISSGYVMCSPHGPLPTIGYEGRRDGILDYRLLCAAEERAPAARAWLEKLRNAVPRTSFSDPPGYYWDVPDTYDPMPEWDANRMRARAVEYLMDATP